MRWIVGLLLIAAALLKAVELYLHPSSVLVDSFSRFLMPLLVGCELGLGLSAVAGLYWRQLRVLAMMLFAVFACYSLVLALQGAASCGCFGPFEINPWWTFLIDTVVFAGLTLECLKNRQVKNTLGIPAKSQNMIPMVGTVMISLAMTIGLGWHVTPRQTSAEDGFQTVGDLIILEPETWIGKEFPLLKYINIDVSQGHWVFLMHRYDCPECQEAVPKYEQLAMLETDHQLALIEVPPHDSLHRLQSSPCRVAQLGDERDWFIQTPVEIHLSDGLVVTASNDLPFLNKVTQSRNVIRNVNLQASETSARKPDYHGDAKL